MVVAGQHHRDFSTELSEKLHQGALSLCFTLTSTLFSTRKNLDPRCHRF